MTRDKLTAEQGLEYVRRKRQIVYPNKGFRRQLELFCRMGYTLDANSRSFRNFLVESYLRVTDSLEDTYQLIDNFFKRLSLAEKMTDNSKSEFEYRCSQCDLKLFEEMAVVQTEDQKHYCGDLYIELQEWMSNHLKQWMSDHMKDENCEGDKSDDPMHKYL